MSSKDRMHRISNHIILTGTDYNINNFKSEVFVADSNNLLDLAKLTPVPDKYAQERKDRLSSENVLWRVENWGFVKEFAPIEVLVDAKVVNNQEGFEFCFRVESRGKTNRLTPYLIELCRIANECHLSVSLSFKNSEGTFGGYTEVANATNLITKYWETEVLTL